MYKSYLIKKNLVILQSKNLMSNLKNLKIMKKIDSNLNEKLGAYIVEYAMCKADMAMGTQIQAIYESPDAYPYFRRMCDTCIQWALGNTQVSVCELVYEVTDVMDDAIGDAIYTQASQVYEYMLEYARMAQEFVYNRVINISGCVLNNTHSYVQLKKILK